MTAVGTVDGEMAYGMVSGGSGTGGSRMGGGKRVWSGGRVVPVVRGGGEEVEEVGVGVAAAVVLVVAVAVVVVVVVVFAIDEEVSGGVGG
jgi:hypothetical protein